MADGTQTQAGQATPSGQPGVTASVTPAPTPAPAPQAAPAADPAPQADPHVVEQTHTLTQSAFKKIKDKSREEGRSAAIEEMAKASGYESADELMKALGKLKTIGTAPAAPKKQQTSNGGERRPDANHDRERSNWSKERDQLLRQAKSASNRVKELEQQANDREVELQLREAAVLNGVKDVDYAVRLLTRAIDGKSEEELKGFDENKFFTDLRKDKPYLFGEVKTPATTGTGTSGQAPQPGQVVATTTTNGQVDVKKMTPQQFQEHLRARGLNATL